MPCGIKSWLCREVYRATGVGNVKVSPEISRPTLHCAINLWVTGRGREAAALRPGRGWVVTVGVSAEEEVRDA